MVVRVGGAICLRKNGQSVVDYIMILANRIDKITSFMICHFHEDMSLDHDPSFVELNWSKRR